MSDSKPCILGSPQQEGKKIRRWALRYQDLDWRLVGGYGFVYHRGSGSTYAMPRLSTEILKRISECASITEQELLGLVAEENGEPVDGNVSKGSQQEILVFGLQPLMDSHLIQEGT